MSNHEQIWTIIKKNMEEFVRLNDYYKIGLDLKVPTKRRKWFLKVNRKQAIITIHPEGGQEDIYQKLSQFVSQKNTDNPGPDEITGARTSETYWFGPFNDLYSAYGYACLAKRFYQKITGQEMPVRTGYAKEFDFSVGGVAF